MTKHPARRQLNAMAVADQTRIAEQDRTGLPALQSEHVSTRGETGGLLAVGIFKLLKAIFFLCVGAGAIHMVHKDMAEVLTRVVNTLRLDPEGRVVGVLMDHAGLLNAQYLRRIGVGAFSYAGLCLIEGTGLVLRKPWAEYFTVILTALGLPLELFELSRHANWFKAGALVLNLAILLYLLWVLKRRRNT